MDHGSQHGKGLLRLIKGATAVSFGILAAIAASMKDFVGGNATFQFSYKTAIAFAAGALAGWLFWGIVGRWARKKNQA